MSSLRQQISAAGPTTGALGFRTALSLLHAAIIVYVAFGWATPSRVGLLVYAVVLPMIILQWLVNGGSSVVTNLEIYARTGHWSDPHERLEGTLFQRILGSFGIHAANSQINVVVVTAMFFFWALAMYRMVLIAVPPVGN
jgi:hypothetical protein